MELNQSIDDLHDLLIGLEYGNDLSDFAVSHESGPSAEDNQDSFMEYEGAFDLEVPVGSAPGDEGMHLSNNPISVSHCIQIQQISYGRARASGCLYALDAPYGSVPASTCLHVPDVPYGSAPASEYMYMDRDQSALYEEAQSTRRSRRRTLTEPSNSSGCQQDDLGSSDTSCGLQVAICEQPEATYRARYRTENCCGPVKSCKNGGFPAIEITGLIDNNMRLQVTAINAEDNKPHPYFQVCPAGRRSDRAEIVIREDGTHCTSISLHDLQRVMALDCIGVIKMKEEEAKMHPSYLKLNKLSKSERPKFRLLIQILASEGGQVVAEAATNVIRSIGKDQGSPEIKEVLKMSGDQKIVIVGKNFTKGARVNFEMSAEESFLGQEEVSGDAITHNSKESIICRVPSSMPMNVPVRMKIVVKNHLQSSPPKDYTYQPDFAPNSLQHQISSQSWLTYAYNPDPSSDDDQLPLVLRALHSG